jgi:hypothetical protein
VREYCTHQLPDPECLACRARPRLRLIAPTAPTVAPPAGEACAECTRPLVPLEGTTPTRCEWCAGASERRVAWALACEAALVAAVRELSEEEFRTYARRGHRADVEAPRPVSDALLCFVEREEGDGG